MQDIQKWLFGLYYCFAYSLSEFLLERQLKKYKLGTLYRKYGGMERLLLVVIQNINQFYILIKADGKNMVVGQYYPAAYFSFKISILLDSTQIKLIKLLLMVKRVYF